MNLNETAAEATAKNDDYLGGHHHHQGGGHHHHGGGGHHHGGGHDFVGEEEEEETKFKDLQSNDITFVLVVENLPYGVRKCNQCEDVIGN